MLFIGKAGLFLEALLPKLNLKAHHRTRKEAYGNRPYSTLWTGCSEDG
jgi:hypothetical protein